MVVEVFCTAVRKAQIPVDKAVKFLWLVSFKTRYLQILHTVSAVVLPTELFLSNQ